MFIGSAEPERTFAGHQFDSEIPEPEEDMPATTDGFFLEDRAARERYSDHSFTF
jgi:hypothetical protein